MDAALFDYPDILNDGNRSAPKQNGEFNIENENNRPT